jgi:hypothetical protein
MAQGKKELRSMFRARLWLLSLVAVMSAFAVLSSSASAISFQFDVNGAKLEAGKSKEFTLSANTPYDLSGIVAGVPALFLFHDLTAHPGALDIGGTPGTLQGTNLYDSVLIERPARCRPVRPNTATRPLKGEIVEGASAGVGNGEVDILFTPETGTTIATFELEGEECLLKGTTLSLTGSYLSLVLPQKTEVLKSTLDNEAVTKEYKNSKGEFKTVGLVLAGNAATLKGSTLMVLASDEKFGVF